MKRLITILTIVICSVWSLHAQHTLGISGGMGTSFIRAYPSIESKPLYGLPSVGFSWRYYSDHKYVGGVGIDLEYMGRGFAYAPWTMTNNNDEGNEDVNLLYYKRTINTLMMPIVWEPHIYVLHNRVRIFGDAAVTFCYNISSEYENQLEESYGNENWAGEYTFETQRDNRFGYGLAGGGGIAFLQNRWEFKASVRYYFGYSDIVKNRNKYYSNNNDDPAENPFSYTPMRSPIDNLNIKVGVSYRLSADGFKSWVVKQRPKNDGLGGGFGYDGL